MNIEEMLVELQKRKKKQLAEITLGAIMKLQKALLLLDFIEERANDKSKELIVELRKELEK